MTDSEARTNVKDAIASLNLIFERLMRLSGNPRLGLPVMPEALAAMNDDDAVRLHGFLRLFEQLHQLLERRVFRGILALSFEDATMSVRNMTDRLEKLGAIESSDVWRELGKVRNALAHDYPANYELHAKRVNDSFAALNDIRRAALDAVAYIEREGLLR